MVNFFKTKVDILSEFIEKRKWIISFFLLLLIITTGLRFSTLNMTVNNDIDEGYYLTIGRNITEGGLPYRELWDNKGPLLYFIFALIIKIAGNSILGLRIITVFLITASSFFIFLISRKILSDSSAMLAAIFFVFLTSSYQLQALTSNSEYFFLVPVLAAVYIAIFTKVNIVKFFLAGILFGMAFNIKTITIFDFLAVALYIFITRNNLKNLLALGFGFFLPTSFFMIFFWKEAMLADYIFIIFQHNIKWATAGFSSTVSFPIFILLCFSLTFSVSLLAIGSVISFFKNSKEFINQNRHQIAFLFGWIILVLVGIFLIRKAYPHHFIHVIPAISILASIYTAWTIQNENRKYAKKYFIVFVIIINCILVSVNLTEQFIVWAKGDINGKIAKLIKINREDYIYSQIPAVYFLTKSNVPTKYAFPSHLLYAKYQEVFKPEFNIKNETQKIIEKKPSYLVLSSKTIPSGMDLYIKNKCILEKEISSLFLYNCKKK